MPEEEAQIPSKEGRKGDIVISPRGRGFLRKKRYRILPVSRKRKMPQKKESLSYYRERGRKNEFNEGGEKNHRFSHTRKEKREKKGEKSQGHNIKRGKKVQLQLSRGN